MGSARKAVFVLVPTGDPPSLRFGHPDVTFGRYRLSLLGIARVTERVRPRFPDAPSGRQPGRSPQRSKEEAERPGDGCPCVGAEEICGAPPLISEGRNEDERRPLRTPSANHNSKATNKYGNSGRVTIDDTPGIPVNC